MKRCTAVALQPARSWHPRRWASHDRATLTPEALLQQVESGLGHDAKGKPLRINIDSKTVSTDTGDLPISPVFDPTWIKSRRRQRKSDPGQPTGRFRRKLTVNPYARALATPIRICSLTEVSLPRHFLQDIELVSHPTTGKPWYAPGPLAFDRILPIHRPTESPEETQPETDAITSSNHDHAPATAVADGNAATSTRSKRAPLTVYTANQKGLLDCLNGKKKHLGKLLGLRRAPETMRGAVWRPDMGDIILGMMRSLVVDTLIHRAARESEPKTKFIEPVASWEEIRDVKRRQSILWLPRNEEDVRAVSNVEAYSTFDVDGVNYDHKMAVYNLPYLLGDKEMARLRESVPDVYGEHELLVLKKWGSQSMVNLHLLLWRLHGYLAPIPKTSPPETRQNTQDRGE